MVLRRRFVEASALLVALLVIGGALGGVYVADHTTSFGVALGTEHQPIAHTDVCSYGANTLLDQEVEEIKVRQTLAMLRDAHFCWIRQEFSWDDIEKTAKGQYWEPKYQRSTWEKYDRIVDLANEYGLQVIVRLDRAPEWARPGLPWKAPPLRYEDFGDFVHTVVERYRGRVRYYQIWNEPNLGDEWGKQPVDAHAYTRLLQIASQRAREADPNVVILTASLAPNDQSGPENLNDLTYLQQMYDAGAGPYFDIVGAQAYGLGNPPDDRRVGFLRMNFSRPTLIREVMVRNGDSAKPIWTTEYAWISLPEGWTGEPSIWGRSVSEEQQAEWLVRGYERARDEWPWMGPMVVWFFREPRARDPRDPTPYFAIVRPDFSPRPAYLALQREAARPVAGVGYHGIDHPAVQGTQTGQASTAASGPGHVGSGVGDETQFTFSGTAISLDLTAAAGARLAVSVDGDAFRPLAGLEEGPEATPRRVVVARGLTDAQHDLRVRVAAVGDAGAGVTVRGFMVGRERSHPWLPTVLYAVLGVLLVLTGARFTRALLLLADDAAAMLRRGACHLAAWYGRCPPRYMRLAIFGAFFMALGLFYWVDSFLLSVIFALTLLLLGYLRPEAGLLGAVLVLSLYYHPKYVGRFAIAPAEALVLVTLLGGVVRGVVRLYHRLPALARGYWLRSANLGIAVRLPLASARLSGFDLPILLFFLAATVSLFTVAGGHPHEALREYRTLIIVPLLFFYLLCTGVREDRALFWLMDGLVLSGVAVALYGLYQFFFTAQGVYAEGVVRIMSVFNHPNALALYLGRVFPFALACALFGPHGRRRALYILATWPLALALFLTYSRAGWVAAVAVVVVLAFATRKKRVLLGLGILLVLAMVAALLFQTERVLSLFHLGEGSNLLRVAVWRSALSMIRDHPVFGIGLDQFLYLYPRYMLPEAASERFTAHPHNVLLDFWLRMGIIGVFALGWLLTRWFRRVKGLLARAQEPSIRVLLLGMLGNMTAFLVHGLFDNSYFLADLALIFWLMIGMAELLGRREAEGKVPPKRNTA